MKKKIGIVTLHSAINYGVYLQAYAIKEAVKDNGYDAEIIHYTKRTESSSASQTKKNKTLSRLTHPFKTLEIIKNIKLKSDKGAVKRSNAFNDFAAYNFDLTATCNNFDDAKRIGEKYDAFVCGSDQIWNPVHTNCNPYYFLQFTDKPKIAYAPSISLREIPEKFKKDFNDYVNSFECLSVRESSGAELVEKETGRKCFNAVDPTLLYDMNKWNEIACEPIQKEEYVLCYFLSYSKTHEKVIDKIQKKFNVKIISIPFNYKASKNKKCENYYASINEFLAFVRDAKFVLTDSFHGVAFSTNFRKDFAVIKRIDAHPDKHLRMKDYLEKTKLSDRIITEKNINDFDFSKVDYTESGKIIKEWANESRKYLSDSLNQCLSNCEKESNNKNILDYFHDDCYGCSACASVCPVNAISMEKNSKGFLYPYVDNEKCLHCGLCVTKCEIDKNNTRRCRDTHLINYIAWIKDEKEILKSSSGGIFYAIAKEILNQGGYVCGAVYDDDFKGAHHIVSKEIEDIEKMRGSKYVQSDKRNVFNEIKSLILENNLVLFSGAPCETAAIRTFVGDNNNLITMSYICHGPNSPEILKSYVDDLEAKFNSKVTSFTTRYKNNEKVLPLHIKAEFENEQEFITEYPSSSFSRIFMSGYAMRNSCLNCKFKCFPPFSDIYVGDTHGKYLNVANYCEKGASYVFSASKKGQELLEAINNDLNIAKADFDIMIRNRNNILFPATAPERSKCDAFWEEYEKEGLNKTVEKLLPAYQLNKGFKLKIKIFIKKILK